MPRLKRDKPFSTAVPLAQDVVAKAGEVLLIESNAWSFNNPPRITVVTMDEYIAGRKATYVMRNSRKTYVRRTPEEVEALHDAFLDAFGNPDWGTCENARRIMKERGFTHADVTNAVSGLLLRGRLERRLVGGGAWRKHHEYRRC